MAHADEDCSWYSKVHSRALHISGFLYCFINHGLSKPFFFFGSRGVEYLHERCRPPVIHRDIKSSNILLDSSFNAKVINWNKNQLPNQTGDNRSRFLVSPISWLIGSCFVNSRITCFCFDKQSNHMTSCVFPHSDIWFWTCGNERDARQEQH